MSADAAAASKGARISEKVGSRDLSIYLLRGLLMCVVVVDHVKWFPSLFGYVTGTGHLFSSAAEGFMLVSGYLVGRIRGAEALAGNLRLATARLLRRAVTLALWTTIVTLCLHAVALLTGIEPADCGTLRTGNIFTIWIAAASLRYVYGHQLFLALYAMYLAAAPLALWALLRRRTVLVLAVSVAIWLVGLLTPGEPAWTQRYESELSWQLLFFCGVVIGFHSDALRARVARLSPSTRRSIYIGAIAATVVTYGLSLALVGHKSFLLSHLFKRDEIGPGRLVCGFLWTGTLYAVLKNNERAVVAAVGRFFVPLGRHSLYVFIVHAPIVYFFCWRPVENFFVATIVDVVLLYFLWFLVRRRVLFSIIPS